MIYVLKQTEISLLKKFIENIDEFYSKGIATYLKKLIFLATSRGYTSQRDIKQILTLLPMVITKEKFEEKKTTDSALTVDWPEYDNLQYEHYINAIKRLQRILSNLFWDNVIHYNSFRKKKILLNLKQYVE